MKIAFVVDSFPSLSETFILDQITGLMELGHEVDIFARYAPGEGVTHPDVEKLSLLDRTSYFGPPLGRARRATRAARLAVRDSIGDPLRLMRALDPRAGCREALSLRPLYLAHALKLACETDYDVLHCHFGPNGITGASARHISRTKTPLVTSFYGYDVSQRQWAQRKGLYRWLSREGDLFIALSDDMIGKLVALGFARDRITKLPLGVNLNEYNFALRHGPRSGRTAVLTVARLAEKKGLEYSIRAIAKVIERSPRLTYQIVGDGPLRGTLESIIDGLGLRDRVKLLGWRDRGEVRSLLREADIFVLPSVTAADGDQEGTPTALLEAQAMGLPVIATLHAGIPEIVIDGRSGFLVPERDVEALATRIAHLIAHPELWADMGRVGRRIVETNHDGAKLSARLQQLYRESRRAGVAGKAAQPQSGPS